MTVTSEQIEPKPCPFCSGTDISQGEVLTTWGAGGTATQSMCNQCGALGPEVKLPTGEVDYGDVRATAAWNRRSDEQTVLALIKQRDDAVRALESAREIDRIRCRQIKQMREQQNGFRPDFLLNGTRFKLNFSSRGNVDVFHNYAKQLQGRWVALVPAEDDMHLAKTVHDHDVPADAKEGAKPCSD